MFETKELQRRNFSRQTPSFNQDYNTQPIYELDYNYSDNSDSDNNLKQIAYSSYL